MTEGNGAMNESWAKLVTKVGIPSAIAVFLVYQLSTRLDGVITKIADDAAAARGGIEQHVMQMNQNSFNTQVLINLNLQQCVNASNTVAERAECFRALYEPPKQK